MHGFNNMPKVNGIQIFCITAELLKNSYNLIYITLFDGTTGVVYYQLF